MSDRAEAWHERRHQVGLWRAWVEGSRDLRGVRDDFLAVANDERLTTHSRAMALMNAANEMSNIGRKFDALELFERAVLIAPGDGMARGNRGMAIARIALTLGGQAHQHMVARALDDLQFAIGAEHLDGDAGETFGQHLHMLEHHLADAPPTAPASDYSDPYVVWVVENDLMLSLAIGLKPSQDDLDPAHLRGLVTPTVEFADHPVPPALEAVNAIKRDFLSTRFLAYLALNEPGEARLSERSRSAFYYDTLDYGRWDLASGLLALGHASAVNLADKIATFLSMWLGLSRDRASDRNWAFQWVRRNKKTKDWMAGPVVRELETLMRPHADRLTSLLGLIDMAQEEAESTPDARRRPLRDAAVHRFLSVRWFGHEPPPALSDAITQEELADAVLAELHRVRRMFFQICWAVAEKGRVDAPGGAAPIQLWPYRGPEDLS